MRTLEEYEEQRMVAVAVTVQEQLDALPVNTVVLDCDDYAWQKYDGGHWWRASGEDLSSIAVAGYAPLTVIHEPGASPA